MKQLIVRSGDGVILDLEIPEISDCFPEKFRNAACKMSRRDRRLLAEVIYDLILPPEKAAETVLPDPSPEEIADAARRGLTALERISRR